MGKITNNELASNYKARVICTSLTRPSNPTNGLEIYETDTSNNYTWNGSTWENKLAVHKADYAQDTGVVNAYAITLSPAPAAYEAGKIYKFKAANANTGASTFAIGALAVTAIKKNVSIALETGDILANQIIWVIYDGTNFQLVPVNTVRKPTFAIADRVAVFDTNENAIKDGGKAISELGMTLNYGTFTETGYQDLGTTKTKTIALGASDYKLLILRLANTASTQYESALVIARTTVASGSCIAVTSDSYVVSGGLRSVNAKLSIATGSNVNKAVSGASEICLEHAYINGSNLEIKWYWASNGDLNVTGAWEVMK